MSSPMPILITIGLAVISFLAGVGLSSSPRSLRAGRIAFSLAVGFSLLSAVLALSVHMDQEPNNRVDTSTYDV